MAQNKDQGISGQDGGPPEDPEGGSNLVRKEEWGSIADILKSIENTSRRSRAPPQGSHKRMPPLTENIQTTQAPGERGQGMQQLDHLLRLMEQMCALRRQNNKLREHAQYLTAIKTLQDIRNEQLLHDCSCEVHRNVSDHSSSSSPMDHNLGNLESFSEPESHIGDDEIENKYRSNRLEKRVGRTITREPKGRSVKKRSKSLDPFGEEAEEELVKERGRPGIFSKFEKMKEKLTNRRGSVKRRSGVKGLDEDGKKFDSELGVPTDGIETKSEDSGFYQNLLDDSILQNAQRFELLQRGEEEISDGEEVFDARQSALGQRTELRQVRKVSDVSTGSSSEDFHESKQKHKKYKSQPPSVPPSGSSLSDHNEDMHRARRKSRFTKSSSFQEFNSSVDTDPSPSTLPDPFPSKRHARLEQSLSMDTDVPEVSGNLGSQSPKMGSVDSKLGQKRKYSNKQPVLDLSDPSLSSSPESRGGDHVPRSSSPPEKKRNKETKGTVEATTKKVPSSDMMTMYENIQANLSEDFLSKLEAWDKKKQKGGSGQDMTKQSSVESVSSEPGAIPTNEQTAELLQGLSEEFSKKLAEWDKKKKGTVGPSPKGDRKQKSGGKEKKEKGKKEDSSGQKKGEGEKLVGTSRKVVVIEDEEGLVKLEGASKDFEEKYREWERMHRAQDDQKKKEKDGESEMTPPQNPYPLPAFQNISDSNASLATPVIVEPKLILKTEQTKHEMASQADFPDDVVEQLDSKTEGEQGAVVDEPISTLERRNSLLAEKLKQKDVNLKVVQSELQVVQEQLEKMAGWKGDDKRHSTCSSIGESSLEAELSEIKSQVQELEEKIQSQAETIREKVAKEEEEENRKKKEREKIASEVSTSSLPGKLEAQVQTIQEEETTKDQTTSNTTEELTRSLQQRENLIRFLQLEVERQRREINFLRSDGSGGSHFKRAKSFSARDRNFDVKAMQVMDVPLSKSLASRGKKDSPNSTPSLSNADSSDQKNRESLSITTESTQSLETLHISAEDIRIDDLGSQSLDHDQKVEEPVPTPAPAPTKEIASSHVPEEKPVATERNNDAQDQRGDKLKEKIKDVSEKLKESLPVMKEEPVPQKDMLEGSKPEEDSKHKEGTIKGKEILKPKEGTKEREGTKKEQVTKEEAGHKQRECLKEKTNLKPKETTKEKADAKQKEGTKENMDAKQKEGTKEKVGAKQKEGTKEKVGAKQKEGTKEKVDAKQKKGTKEKVDAKQKEGTKEEEASKQTEGTKEKGDVKQKEGTKEKVGAKQEEGTKEKADAKQKEGTKEKVGARQEEGTRGEEASKQKEGARQKEVIKQKGSTKVEEGAKQQEDTKVKKVADHLKEKEDPEADGKKTNSKKPFRGKQHPLDVAIPSSIVAQKISSLKEKSSSASDSDSKDEKTGVKIAKSEPKRNAVARVNETKLSGTTDSSKGETDDSFRRSRSRFRERDHKTSSNESSTKKIGKTSEEVEKALKDLRGSSLKHVQVSDKKPPLPSSLTKNTKDSKSVSECLVESDHDTSLKSDSEIKKSFDATSAKRRDSSDSVSSSRKSSPATRLIEKYDPSFARSLATSKVEVNTVEDLKAKFSGGSQSANSGSKSEDEDSFRARRERPKVGSVKMLSQAFAVTQLVNKEEGGIGKGSGTAASSVLSTPSSVSPASSCSSLSSSHVSDRIKRLQDRRVQSLKDKGNEKSPTEETKPPLSPKGKEVPKIQAPLLPNKAGYRSSLPNLTAVKAKFEQVDSGSGDDKTKSGTTPLRVRQKSGSTGKLSFTVSVTETKTETERNSEVKPIRVRARPPRLVAVIETPGKDKNATETVTVRLRSPTARRSTRTNNNVNNSNKKANELHISEPEIKTETQTVSATVTEDISASAPSLSQTSSDQKSILDQAVKPGQIKKTSQEREDKVLSSSDPQMRGSEKETSAESMDEKMKKGEMQSVGQVKTDQRLDKQGSGNLRRKLSVTDGNSVLKEETGTSLTKEDGGNKEEAKGKDLKEADKPGSESGDGSYQTNTETKSKTSGQTSSNLGKKSSKGGGKDSKGKKGGAGGQQRGEQKTRKSKNGQQETTTAPQVGERKDGKSKSKRKGNKRAEQRREQEANSKNSLDSERHSKGNDSEGSRSSLNGDNFPDLLAETPKVRDSVIIDDNGNKTRNPRQAVAASALQGAAAAIGHALPDPATTAELDEAQGDERRSRKDKTRRGRMLSKADRLSKLDLFRRAKSVDTSKTPRDRSPSLERPGRSGRASSVDRSKKREKSPAGVKGKAKDKDGQRGGWKRILRASNESVIDSVNSASDSDAPSDTASVTTASEENLTEPGSVTNLHDKTSDACVITNGVNVVGSSIFYC